MRCRPALPLALALLSACGPSAPDACAVPTGDDVTLSNVPPSSLAVRDAALTCTGTSQGAQLACGDAATLTAQACADGFAFVLAGGAQTLLLHLKSLVGTWRAGAQLAGAEALRGAWTCGGLPAPTQLAPAKGAAQAGSGTLQSATAVVDFEFRTTW